MEAMLDGLLFNWKANAWLATMSLALDWETSTGAGRIATRARIARSWTGSFAESDRVQAFNEAANIYALRAEYAHPSGLQMLGRPASWVLHAGYAGFLGANRMALGFDTVAEVRAGIEIPVSLGNRKMERLSLSVGRLFGPDVRGWMLGLGLRY